MESGEDAGKKKVSKLAARQVEREKQRASSIFDEADGGLQLKKCDDATRGRAAS